MVWRAKVWRGIKCGNEREIDDIECIEAVTANNEIPMTLRFGETAKAREGEMRALTVCLEPSIWKRISVSSKMLIIISKKLVSRNGAKISLS